MAFLGWGNAFGEGLPTDFDTRALETASRFTTWQGIEPDKWATIWLIKRYVAPDAYFLLVPPNSTLPDNAYAFAVPESPLRRANRQSMFRRLKQAMKLDAPELNYLDGIIQDIEVNIWDASSHPHSTWFETMYRKLQARYNRDQVPVDCYLEFFDGVARLSTKPDIQAKDYTAQLSLEDDCPGPGMNKNAFIGQFNHKDILREFSLGNKVIFVDTREDEEYNEIHLPGARLLPLRDVDADSVKSFMDADLVVPYCVKDFRGFEVAKAMKRLGVRRVATLSPNGLKGWLQAKLPVVRAGVSSEHEAMDALMRCATEPSICLQRVKLQ